MAVLQALAAKPQGMTQTKISSNSSISEITMDQLCMP